MQVQRKRAFRKFFFFFFLSRTMKVVESNMKVGGLTSVRLLESNMLSESSLNTKHFEKKV